MRCLDTTFCIDLANGVPAARAKVEELEKQGDLLAIAAPALTEFLIGAFSQGGKRLTRAMEFVAQLQTLDVTEPIAMDAARLGGECVRRGEAVAVMDLLIAATARHHRAIVLTRDPDFSRIPGLSTETY
jgi:tRNA(fMet)-specific endonuclease VapC